ncbi:MAG: hypothetical protein ACYDHH_07395 [Solirubrobacteraceae bacterium]
MTPKNKITETSRPAKPRPSPAERRAAQVAVLATRQAELKQEAEERRRAREKSKDAPKS